mmetsp:Transcript_51326/g.135608  ORF Transcript_51326/g.135608 Transcript_51326/m.135608 type:complete len:200 (+) Transcript_51326:1916-2515(+)
MPVVRAVETSARGAASVAQKSHLWYVVDPSEANVGAVLAGRAITSPKVLSTPDAILMASVTATVSSRMTVRSIMKPDPLFKERSIPSSVVRPGRRPMNVGSVCFPWSVEFSKSALAQAMLSKPLTMVVEPCVAVATPTMVMTMQSTIGRQQTPFIKHDVSRSFLQQRQHEMFLKHGTAVQPKHPRQMMQTMAKTMGITI